jgi:stearoyl-CoA desaturase (delta-9 desaturase)
MGWTVGKDQTNAARFTPDLLAGRDIARISRRFPLWTAVSLLAPPCSVA